MNFLFLTAYPRCNPNTVRLYFSRRGLPFFLAIITLLIILLWLRIPKFFRLTNSVGYLHLSSIVSLAFDEELDPLSKILWTTYQFVSDSIDIPIRWNWGFSLRGQTLGFVQNIAIIGIHNENVPANILSGAYHVNPQNIHYMTCENYPKRMINQVFEIVLVGDCFKERQSMSIENCYDYADTILHFLRGARTLLPYSLIVWITNIDLVEESKIVQKLMTYLAGKYIIADIKVVLFPMGLYYRALSTAKSNFPTSSIPPSALQCIRDLLAHFVFQVENTFKVTWSPIILRSDPRLSLQPPPSALQETLSARCSSLINTRKYDSLCLPRPAVLLPVLITGLGGAGTHYLHSVGLRLGLRLSHEDIDAHGSVVMATPSLPSPFYPFL